MRAWGARTVAVVNNAGGPLERSADLTINVEAGTEQAVPATKSVTATFLALGIVAQALGRVPWRARQIAGMPRVIAALLDDGHPSLAVALLPIAGVVRAQQLAQLVARVRGLDADAPAGLRKVTLTR